MWIRHFWYQEKRLNCFQCLLNPGWIMFWVRFLDEASWWEHCWVLTRSLSPSRQRIFVCPVGQNIFYSMEVVVDDLENVLRLSRSSMVQVNQVIISCAGVERYNEYVCILSLIVLYIFVSPCSFPGTLKKSFVTTVISVSCWEGERKLQIACDRCSFLVAKHFISSHQQLSPIQREEMQLFTANLSLWSYSPSLLQGKLMCRRAALSVSTSQLVMLVHANIFSICSSKEMKYSVND